MNDILKMQLTCPTKNKSDISRFIKLASKALTHQDLGNMYSDVISAVSCLAAMNVVIETESLKSDCPAAIRIVGGAQEVEAKKILMNIVENNCIDQYGNDDSERIYQLFGFIKPRVADTKKSNFIDRIKRLFM